MRDKCTSTMVQWHLPPTVSAPSNGVQYFGPHRCFPHSAQSRRLMKVANEAVHVSSLWCTDEHTAQGFDGRVLQNH